MKTLHIYPTSRAIRYAREKLRKSEGFVPDMMRIDEFEQRVLLVPGYAAADRLHRRLLLRDAADFDAFKVLGVPRRLTRFLAHSDAFFRFFEELSGEKVTIESLAQADVYAEYADHLALLEELWRRYEEILDEKRLYDKASLWRKARFNEGFVRRYDTIVLHLEGYLTRAETELFAKAAKHTCLEVRFRLTRYAQKMRERFKEIGVTLPEGEYDAVIDLTQQRLIDRTLLTGGGATEVIAVEERIEQVGAVIAAVSAYVERGIAPEKIAVVLPDESFAVLLRQFDRVRNFNFAMGFPYRATPSFLALKALYDALNETQDAADAYWQASGYEAQERRRWEERTPVGIDRFFDALDALGIVEEASYRDEVALQKERFGALFATERLKMREWLFLWMQQLETLRIDDTEGGKVTVLGVLETRAAVFDAVVIPDFNDGIVPAVTRKERFLNGKVRKCAGLPSRSDRENLQKYYYDNLLRRCRYATIIYARSDARLPSKFLFELGLDGGVRRDVPRELFYDVALLPQERDIEIAFDPFATLWSASRLSIWVRCPRRYYYRYIRGLEDTSQDRFNEGAYIHHVLHRLFEDLEEADGKTLRKRLRTLLERLHPQGGTKARFDGMLYAARLEAFVASQVERFAQGWRIAACETTLEATLEGLRFSGRIDRIDMRENRRVLIDYKTGKLPSITKHTTAEMITDFQMPLYEALAGGDVELRYCRVFEGEWVEPKRMELQREAFAMRIEALKQTQSLVASKTEDLQQCTFCAYRLICERGEYLNA